MDTSVLADIDSLDEEVKELWKLLRTFRDHPNLADLSDEEFRKHLAWELELFILAREFEPIIIDYATAADEVREGTVTLGGRTPWADLRFLTNYELFSGVDIAKRKEILSFLRGEHEKAEGIEDIGDMKRKGKVDDFLNTLFDGSPPDGVTGVSVDIAYGASYGHMTMGDVLYEDMRRNVMQMTAAFAALGIIYAMGINTPFKKPVLSRRKPRRIDGNESDLNFRINEEAASNWGTGGSGPQNINPNQIRFSQSSVNGSRVITASMRRNGWRGDPIDVVRMPDGRLTAVDNTRVASARAAGIDARANVRNFNDPLPANMVDRFTTRRGVPRTWGEAVESRIQNQNSNFRNNNPSGSFELDRIN